GADGDEGGPARLRATGRDRGDHLAGRARVRAAPRPLPRPRQDPPPARGDRGRDQCRAPRRLVPGGPARRHPHLALRRPRHRLSRLRQRYLVVYDKPTVAAQAVLTRAVRLLFGGKALDDIEWFLRDKD